MNERIKELAHKADFIGKKNNGAEWRWGYIDPELAEKLETFAELIVRECATLVDAAFDVDEHSGEVVSYADGGQLKEHFGVEE